MQAVGLAEGTLSEAIIFCAAYKQSHHTTQSGVSRVPWNLEESWNERVLDLSRLELSR